MGASIAAAIAALFVVAGLVSAARGYWLDARSPDGGDRLPEFLRWVRLGLIFPFCWWLAWNLLALLARTPGVPPLLATGPIPVGSAPPWPVLLVANAAVLAVFLSIAWSAITFLWLLPGLLRESDDAADFKSTAIAASLAGLALIIWPVWRGSIGGITLVILAWAWLLVHNAAPRLAHPQPLYSRAIAHLKFGRYAQAEEAVIGELEKKDDDYDGWLMLAQMYAEHFGEMGEAERTIHELCAQPGLGPFQVSHALNRLADWQLRLGDDPTAARRTLAGICERFPDTTYAAGAQHRLRELPLSREEARQNRQPRTIRLPALAEGPREGGVIAPTAEQKLRLREEAARLSERLEVYPDQTPVRERLARILAEGLGEIDAAIRHIRVLLDASDPSTPRRAEWLGLLAAWNLNLRHDETAARKLFEQIIREYPATPQSLASQRQLTLIEQSNAVGRLPIVS